MDCVLNAFRKAALLTVGTISFGIGVLGLILPFFPGTPFLILSAICFKLALVD
ncbi:MAG: DUF454 family protein [Synechococcales cyanobacterium C42_A2020_086]|nr:DUF454 family protein [Synechococcales cyanobacterium M58_A2018_015]MBF2074822.1 DUF454 family protein [Synechococcales cyanobacterium C42_A2020_086]